MNKIYLRNTIFTLIFLFTLTSAVMYSSGPSAVLTNAPSEGNCTNCHSGSLITSGTNFNKIFLTTGFQGGGYVPDSTYTIALSFKQSGISKYGFQITCLTSTGNTPVGTFTAIGSRVQKLTATVSGNTRQYIQHTSSGTDTVKKDSARWIFTWKAPSSNVGKIKFYVCMNATNNNSSDNGDAIYAKTFEYSASPLLPVADASSIDSVTCTNYNAQMTGKGTNTPTSYSWVFRGANIGTSTVQNPIVKFTTTTNTLAILTVKNILGTSGPDTLKVTVRPSPSSTITNGSAGTICKGDSIQLLGNSNLAPNVTYKWSPSNKTTKNIFVKDTGIYNVSVTSLSNSCVTTSANYKLSWYAKPIITLTKSLTKDTFCDQINETFTASGTTLDSIYWYVNNQLFTRTKSLSLNFTSKTNSTVNAIGKSINNCFSVVSNTFNLKITPKLYPSNFSNTKTTNSIDLKWKKNTGIDSTKYSLNNVSFFKTSTDTTLLLTGLQPSTFYNITIRSYQNGVCKFTDTTLSIKTNNCSNLTYNIVMNPKVCKGNTLSVVVKGLRKTKVSISFNNLPFTKDSTYSFSPVTSDSLSIRIIDSLSLACPPILEKQAYLIDTFPQDNGSYTFNHSSCTNKYTHSISPLYQNYEFFKNNVSVYNGSNNQFNHSGLATGDKLSARITINSCSKDLGTITFTLSPSSDAKFTYNRNWKTYTFKPNDSANTNYSWFINDTLVANTKNFVKDMSKYNKKTAKVKLKTTNASNCSDSSEQSITFPDFLSIPDISNYQLNIFPNPFNGEVNIVTNLHDYKLNVYDNLGRNILQLNDLNFNQSLNTADWISGLYHIVLSNDQLKLDRILIKVQ